MTRLRFSGTAIKALDRLPKDRARQIKGRIEAMAAGEQSDVKRLLGTPHHRLRVGRYRVIFRREGDIIAILDIRVRGRAY